MNRKLGYIKLDPIELPDLTKLFPDKYSEYEGDTTIFHAETDADFNLMERLIKEHHYYDSLGVWGSGIDIDKRVSAAIAQGLGAVDILEIGCFNGSVLSLLKDKGIRVTGVDLSHLAFILAHRNVVNNIRFGDVLELDWGGRRFNTIMAMDIIEHFNPVRLNRYIDKLSELLEPNGLMYINSPMFGKDDQFGQVFDAYLPDWEEASDVLFWRKMHCDQKGWPLHGHLVWGSPSMWERLFYAHDLIRDRSVERVIHNLLNLFFKNHAPARKSFFVLRHKKFIPDQKNISESLKMSIEPLFHDEGGL